MFEAGNHHLEQGFHVIDIRRNDLIAKKDLFAWGRSDIRGALEQNRPKANASKFEQERYKVDSLLRFLGHANFSVSEPDPRDEIGIDVVVELDHRKIGFQVTDLHSDEAPGAARKGSELRREENQKVADGLPAAMFVNPNPMPGLVRRIKDKSMKQWSEKDFPEVVLLIGSSASQIPAIDATFLWDARLDVNEMNEQLSPILERTKYSAAYVYNMLLQSVYKWTRKTGWEKVPRYE